MSADLPQLASPDAGRDLAAAAQLLRRRRTDRQLLPGDVDQLVAEVDQVLAAEPLPADPTAVDDLVQWHRQLAEVDQPLPPVRPVVVDQVVDVVEPACVCTPGMICDEARCDHCAALDPALPCPHDTFVDELDEAERFAGVHAAAVDVYDQLAAELPAAEVVEPAAAAYALPVDVEPPAVDWPAVADKPLAEVAGVVVGQVHIEPPARPTTGHLPTLDWRSRHDPRSLAFGARARGLAAPAVLADVDLDLGPVLDQGPDGECVGYALATAINALRLTGHTGLDGGPAVLDDQVAQTLYARAQRLDDRPGEDYSGTSVLAGCQAAVEAGLIGGYLWDFGTRDIALTLMRRRPVVVGIPMLSGMFDTAPDGVVRVVGEPTGTGHALAIVSLRLKGPAGQPGPWFRWQNTWGTGYGVDGIGWVHHRDLAALLRSQGEAAVPTIEAQR